MSFIINSYFPCFSLLLWKIKFTFRAYTKNTRFPNGHLICKALLLVIFVDTSLTYISQFSWQSSECFNCLYVYMYIRYLVVKRFPAVVFLKRPANSLTSNCFKQSHATNVITVYLLMREILQMCFYFSIFGAGDLQIFPQKWLLLNGDVFRHNF